MSALGAALLVGLIGYVLLFGLGARNPEREAKAITLVAFPREVRQDPRPKPRVERPILAVSASRPAPRNLRNKATPIVAPPAIVPPLAPSPILAATRAGEGAAVSTGASDRPGDGTGAGAGASGEGTGAGGTGEGEDNGGDSPPRLVKGRLRYTDLSRDLREGGIGGTVGVRYEVGTDGSVGACEVTRSSGNPDLDTQTCALIQRRFRYRPSRDATGTGVESTIEETHRWIVAPEMDRDGER